MRIKKELSLGPPEATIGLSLLLLVHTCTGTRCSMAHRAPLLLQSSYTPGAVCACPLVSRSESASPLVPILQDTLGCKPTQFQPYSGTLKGDWSKSGKLKASREPVVPAG